MLRIGYLMLLVSTTASALSANSEQIRSSSALVIQVQVEPQRGMEDCRRLAGEIKVGMTRADISARMAQEGGIGGIYKNERAYYFTAKGSLLGFYAAGEKYARLCKLRFDFRPLGMPEEDYDDPERFSLWIRNHYEKLRNEKGSVTSPCPSKQSFSLPMRILRRIAHPIRGTSPPVCPGPLLILGEPSDEVVRISGPFLEFMIVD